MNRYLFLLILNCQFSILNCFAQNPIVQTAQTTDPAPFVWNDTLYVYTGHDEYGADFFWMQDWRVYSTTDMVNWTDRGTPLALEDFSWANDRAWAAQLCQRNGKFYWYICAVSKLTNTMAIGVAVGDSPVGPFHDPIGKPLYEGSWDNIDPTVLIDDDGRAFLYWGNPSLYYVELNEDMISFKTEVKRFDFDEASFGGPGMKDRKREDMHKYKDIYTEGPWILKRNVSTKAGNKKTAPKGEGKGGASLYYMLYAAGGVPEHIAYSTAPGPLGPWTYRGTIMPQCDTNKETGVPGTDSFTNHCGVINYKGHDYFFYHNGWLGGGFGRAVAVEEFKYNADGTFPTIMPTREGITNPLAAINPFARVEAETMAFSKGIHSEESPTGVYISDIHNGDYIKVRCVDFSKVNSNTEIAFRLASALRGGTIEMHIDSLGGEKIAEVYCPGTGGWEQWQTFKTKLTKKVIGVHDVYFNFVGRKGPKLFNFDWWQLSTTVANPWLWSDVPDPDIIRVGDYYYLVSTTMHLMPGGPIMRSTDLVNWETVSYLFDTINDTPRYDLNNPEVDGTTYGRGQWATSIRYHKGMFWALHSPNDDPHRSFLMKTTDPAKGWTLHARLPHFHDSSLFFDDDDKCYVFSGGGNVRLVELNESMTDIKEGGIDKILNTREFQPEGLLEGSRVIKHGDYYYLIMISWPRTGRQQVAYRSKNIEGPYEGKVILKSEFGGFPYVGQGTVVDGKDGEWYGVIFQDRGGVGRVLTLNPVHWVDGWPIIGDDNGKVPASMELFTDKPLDETNHISIVKSDEFDNTSTLYFPRFLLPYELSQQAGAMRGDGGESVPVWQWNHNPDNSMWSLDERPGFLRLKAIRNTPPSGAGGLYHAKNTLTQRMEGPVCSGAISMDISQMQDGDRAGFAAFNGHSAIMTVEKVGKKTSLVLSYEEVSLADDNKAITNVKREDIARVALGSKKNICLRINGDFRPKDSSGTAGGNDIATFEYSLDNGKTWVKIGGDYIMRFDYRRLFMGTKFAIFNYSTKGMSDGYVDIDWFHYTHNND